MSGRTVGEEAIWHDVECGAYTADLPVWAELAAGCAGAVLELGAGTGRVALDLARRGHDVVAVDHSAGLLAELERRAVEWDLEVETVRADVRELALDRRFALICAPMQLVHLLGGFAGREAALRAARAHLEPGGRFAAALLAQWVESALDGDPPLPDVAERDGWVYSSLPLAASRKTGGIEVRRLRQVVAPGGGLTEALDVTFLDHVDPDRLESEAQGAGLSTCERIEVPATHDHVGSTVVVLEAT